MTGNGATTVVMATMAAGLVLAAVTPINVMRMPVALVVVNPTTGAPVHVLAHLDTGFSLPHLFSKMYDRTTRLAIVNVSSSKRKAASMGSSLFQG